MILWKKMLFQCDFVKVFCLILLIHAFGRQQFERLMTFFPFVLALALGLSGPQVWLVEVWNLSCSQKAHMDFVGGFVSFDLVVFIVKTFEISDLKRPGNLRAVLRIGSLQVNKTPFCLSGWCYLQVGLSGVFNGAIQIWPPHFWCFRNGVFILRYTTFLYICITSLYLFFVTSC